MSKKNQLIVFALVVVLGLFLMDTYLFGKAQSCRCIDSFLAQEECMAACALRGECVSWVQSSFEGSCYFFNCVYRIENYCEVTGENKIVIEIGYLYSDCYSCGTWI